ncbi:hypothetical protein ACSSS7_007396 [Eimeria intestinalis]
MQRGRPQLLLVAARQQQLQQQPQQQLQQQPQQHTYGPLARALSFGNYEQSEVSPLGEGGALGGPSGPSIPLVTHRTQGFEAFIPSEAIKRAPNKEGPLREQQQVQQQQLPVGICCLYTNLKAAKGGPPSQLVGRAAPLVGGAPLDAAVWGKPP